VRAKGVLSEDLKLGEKLRRYRTFESSPREAQGVGAMKIQEASRVVHRRASSAEEQLVI
jgi:hypothetical protein